MPLPPPLPLISLQHIDKRFASGLLALQDVSLHTGATEFVSLLGPSGCGKSTVLRLIAGLEEPSAGQIHSPARVAARPSEASHADAAQTAFVFQDPTLMPWASVRDNVWLPLRLSGVPRADAQQRIDSALGAVGLTDFSGAFPAELSGGMKMRASIARALVTRPQVLLMDEPFAALDEITRQKLNTDLLSWWQAQQLAVLFVTHSVFESVFLSQRVLVMAARPGRVIAEVVIDEPYPRSSEFRTSTRHAQLCRTLSQALESTASDHAR